MSERSSLYVPIESKMEALVIDRMCKPILARLPESVSPNTLTYINHVVCWIVLVFGAIAPGLDPVGAMLARIAAGVGVFLSMLLDCLDGMQARRTGRASRLGEVLDHWCDGLNMPLIASAMALTLELEPWSASAVMMSMGACYVAQLVIYHLSGRFVQCPTAGVQAQFLLAFSFVAFAVFLYLVDPRETDLINGLSLAFAWVCVAAAVKQLHFYYKQAPALFHHNLKYFVLAIAVGLLGGFNVVGLLGTMLLYSFVIFRVSGNYVLRTLLGQAYLGFDWLSAVWISVTVIVWAFFEATQIAGYPLGQIIPYVACVHLGLANTVDLVRHVGELRFMDQQAASG